MNHRAEQPDPTSSQSQQLADQLIQDAQFELASILEQTVSIPTDTSGSPLLRAMGLVGHALGVSIQPPIAKDPRQLHDPIGAIAQASRIRVRHVRLNGNWWLQNQGALLGFRDDRQPIALLPTSKGYELVDPITRTRTLVNTTLASKVLPNAYVLYRSLPEKIHTALALLWFSLRGLKPNLRQILVSGVIVTLLGMLLPQLLAVLINQVIPAGDRDTLWQIGVVLVAVAFGQFAFQISQNLSMLSIDSLSNNALQPAVWDWLLRLTPGFFRQFTAGDLVRRVLSIRLIHQKFNGATQRTLLGAVFALLNLVLMVVYNASLAVIGIGIAIAIAGATIVATSFAIQQSRQLQTLDGMAFGLAVQLINSVAKLRVAMAEERAFAVWAKQYTQRLRLKAQLQTISDRLSILNEGLPLLGTALLFGFALPLLQSSQMTTGIFLAFLFAFSLFLKGVTDLCNTLMDLSMVVPIWERLQPILQAPLEVDSSKAHPGQLTGRLALENVSFRYHDHTPLILDNVSLYAEPGEFVAIVGPSGSGKSTILRLLLGFEKPLNGRVLYNNQDLATLNLQAVRRSLGVVLQNGQITTGSIFETITGGALASLEDAWNAAEMAGLADDIQAMPMGMHTIVSEGASNLSGGQRQRLLIARALVSQPQILLMDEATSALDNRTQAIVTASLKQLKVTRIVIAHRLSTIQDADRLYVLDAGRVIQSGNFSSLIQQDGLFQRLAKRQI